MQFNLQYDNNGNIFIIKNDDYYMFDSPNYAISLIFI